MSVKVRRHVPFVCPRCQKPMRVRETRERDGAIWRRRSCPEKHAQVFTVEAIDTLAA